MDPSSFSAAVPLGKASPAVSSVVGQTRLENLLIHFSGSRRHLASLSLYSTLFCKMGEVDEAGEVNYFCSL